MAAGVGGGLKFFWTLVNNWKKTENAELRLSSENGHLLVKYSVDMGVWVSPAPRPSSETASRGHQGPRKGAGPSQQRRRERRAAERAASIVNENATTEEVVANSAESVKESAKEHSENHVIKSAEVVDAAGNEKVKKVIAEENPVMKAAEQVALRKPASERSKAEQEKTEETVNAKTNSARFECDECNYTNQSEKGLKQHKKMKHRIAQSDGADDNDLEPLANSTFNAADTLKLNEDKTVQTETNIDLVLEGEVCEDCEEELIGETLWRIPDGFYLDLWHTHSVRKSPIEGYKVNQFNGNIVNKKTLDVIGTVVNGLTHTLY